MAQRTLSEIYDAMAVEKANMGTLSDWFTNNANPASVLDDHQTLLEDLSSTSKVAIWRLFMWIVAVAIWIHEGLWYVFKSEVDTAIAANMAHTTQWYKEESLKFQYGDELVWNTDTRRYEYPIYDANKLIIARAATGEGKGIVAIKVARLLSGVLAPLSTEQKTAFTTFWSRYKDAGVIINIISESADLLKLAYTIYYDPLVLSADGSLISDATTKPVEDAINTYIANLPFDGRFRLEACDAAIREASGVIDFQRTSAQSKYGTNSYTDIAVSRVPYGGYFVIDPANPLTTQLTYTPDV